MSPAFERVYQTREQFARESKRLPKWWVIGRQEWYDILDTPEADVYVELLAEGLYKLIGVPVALPAELGHSRHLELV